MNETRDSGFKNFDEAKKWNIAVIKRKLLKNEFKIDNSSKNAEDTIRVIIKKIYNNW